jgi:hypothetical protein
MEALVSAAAHAAPGSSVAGKAAEGTTSRPWAGLDAPRERLLKTSRFRGVSATENTQWRARIRYGKFTVHLGR